MPPDHLEPILGSAVDTWATVGVAIGTIGAVAYALFRDLVVTPRRRPSLDLRFDSTGNDQVVIETAEGTDAAHVRLRVANREGKDTADEVVVIVTECRRLAEQATAEATPIGLPLTWSATSPPQTVSAVHPGSERHIDLVHVEWPAGDETETMSLELDLTPKPAGGRDMLDPGAYEIAVEIRARNADAIRYAVPVSWDGGCSRKETVWEHLRVEPPRKVG